MHEPPQLSVVVPAYNAEKYLAAALASILAQNHPSLEIVVVNDGSTDGTLEIAKSYGPQVQCLSQAQAGAASARNRGVQAARGEYLAFLDADDLWTEEKLQLQWTALQSSGGMIFGHLEQFISPDIDPQLNGKYHCDITASPARVAGTLLMKKSHFLETGLFENWRIGEFIEWYDRARRKSFGETMLSQTLLRRRIHGNNTTIREADISTEYLKIVKSVLDRKRKVVTETKAE